jgi:hypothetical protein
MISIALALASITCASMSPAQAGEPAAEPTGKLTLACKGTFTTKKNPTGLTWAPLSSLYAARDNPQPVSLGLLFDFTSKTVEGFDFYGATKLKIIDVDELRVAFGASHKELKVTWQISGRLDRLTADVEAHSAVYDGPVIGDGDGEAHYSLKCKPTQRMF